MTLHLRDISLVHGDRTILRGINLQVEPGTVTSLLGPSGAGKSTLLRMAAGLLRPTSGEVLLDDPADPSRNTGNSVAMIFQSLALWPHMTLRQHLEFVMDRRRYPTRALRREEAVRLLSSLRLPLDRNLYPARLSGGEQQRLAIGRALAQAPAYLLMDEPFSSLDDLLRDELLTLTKSLKEDRNIGILYVTHRIDEALALSDRLVVLQGGGVTGSWQGDDIAQCDRDTILACFRR
ncbi:MAG: ABC transporter ATP-binding protein [Thermodesulfobacteriota bacterium]